MVPIVTIDGPSGSGKGTISKAFEIVPLPEPEGPSIVTIGTMLLSPQRNLEKKFPLIQFHQN